MILEIISAVVILIGSFLLVKFGNLILSQPTHTKGDRLADVAIGVGVYSLAALLVLGLVNQVLLRVL